MKKHRLGPWFAITLALAPPAFSQQAPGAPARQEAPPAIYDESADAKEQIADALANAKKNNRRVLIQWGANWCGWCHRLHALFEGEAAVKRTLSYEYDVVLVDIGKWDKHMDLASGYGADLASSGVPYLTILDADGKPLANQETGSLEEASGKFHHSPGKVTAFLTKHQAPYQDANVLLDKALARAKAEGKLAFVHFGAPWCGWCHRLEDWMAREDVAPILERAFVDLKIDVDRSEGSTGKDLYAKLRQGPEGGIPWFAFLAGDGKTLATSTGEKGNVGFPYEDFEIAHFVEMLKATSLATEDVEKLRATLAESKKKDAEARAR